MTNIGLGGLTLIFFIGGLGLMFISDGFDLTFTVGLIFFIISILIMILSITWSIAGSAEKATNRFINGDTKD